MEVDSGLILVAVTPLRTKDVEAKEEQLELFCMDFGENRWYQNCWEEKHKHVACSSSWIRHLLQKLDCLELEKHTMGVCDWIESQTNPHWEIWAFENCNLPPFDPRTIPYWEACLILRDGRQECWNSLGMWQILRITLCSRHQWKISHTSIHRLGECVPPVFVLRFYGPVNPMGSCRAQSVYLTTRLLGRLSPPSG